MRFHRVISMGKKVLAALTRTDSVFPLQTQTMHFRSSNKLCHMIQVSLIHPWCLVHPFHVHDHENLAHINSENGAYKWSSMEKRRLGSSRSNFSLLHVDLDLDLEKNHQNHGKERRLRVWERESTSCDAFFNKSKGKTSPPRKWPLFRVLRLKPEKIEEPWGRRVGVAAFIAQT